jgi:hypothetical protein
MTNLEGRLNVSGDEWAKIAKVAKVAKATRGRGDGIIV